MAEQFRKYENSDVGWFSEYLAAHTENPVSDIVR
jgi:hypothetical protein